MNVTLLCLALAVFSEARGEPELGRIAVAQVVLNRMEFRELEACDVLLEKGQFSFKPAQYFDKPPAGSKLKPTLVVSRLPTHRKGWGKSVLAAEMALKQRNSMGGIEFFHAKYVNPEWGTRFIWVFSVGGHVFYARKTGIYARKPA